MKENRRQMLIDRVPVRLRLSLGHALWMGILFSGIGFGIYRLIEHRFYQSVDAALRTTALNYRSNMKYDRRRDETLDELMEQFLPEDFNQSFRPFGQIINLSGNVSARTPNAFNANLPVSALALGRAEQGLETIENYYYNGVVLRQISIPVIQHGRFTGELIQVGAPLGPILDTLKGVQNVLWIALPSGLGLSIIFGYFLTARSLKPVRSVTKAAGRLGSDELSTRLPLPLANDEIRVLVTTFNGMLDRLEDAFNRLRRFTGDVSHELRTPLSVLRGEAELALRRARDPEYYQTSLKTIQQEAENMTAVIEDLLLLAKAQSKSVAMHWQEIEPGEYLRKVIDSVASQAKSKEVTVELKISSPSHLLASPNYLAIAIKNLLTNALKHSFKGGKVEMFAWRDQKAFHISVRDFGEGIPGDSLPYVFDTFYRADTARNRAMGGIGIGLSLAKAMANLHGGNITLESREGEGAHFVISIPQDRSRLDEDAAGKTGLS